MAFFILTSTAFALGFMGSLGYDVLGYKITSKRLGKWSTVVLVIYCVACGIVVGAGSMKIAGM